jgi:hypothetical protein
MADQQPKLPDPRKKLADCEKQLAELKRKVIVVDGFDDDIDGYLAALEALDVVLDEAQRRVEEAKAEVDRMWCAGCRKCMVMVPLATDFDGLPDLASLPEGVEEGYRLACYQDSKVYCTECATCKNCGTCPTEGTWCSTCGEI